MTQHKQRQSHQRGNIVAMNRQTQTVIAIVGGIVVLGFLARRQVAQGVEAIAAVNEGTPFEGAGVVGTLGNAANTASGGVLADIGSSIGLFFSDIFDTRTLDDFG